MRSKYCLLLFLYIRIPWLNADRHAGYHASKNAASYKSAEYLVAPETPLRTLKGGIVATLKSESIRRIRTIPHIDIVIVARVLDRALGPRCCGGL